MAKAPAFQFYVKDWLSDPQLQMASFTTKGIWITMLCYMWEASQRGELIGTKSQICRLMSLASEEFDLFIKEAQSTKFADIYIDGDVYIINNRRMLKESQIKIGNADRQARFREKGGGDPDRWTAIRIKILQRDKYMCAFCGRKADTVDHLIPKSKGGGEEDINLVACCKRCNTVKNNRLLSEANMCIWEGFRDREKFIQQYNSRITSPPPSSSSSPFSNNKTLYLECVYLIPEEYQKLVTKHGQFLTDKAISILNNYIMGRGKDPYKSHYHTLIGWPMERAGEKYGQSNGRGARNSSGGSGVQTAPPEREPDLPISEDQRLANLERVKALIEGIVKD